MTLVDNFSGSSYLQVCKITNKSMQNGISICMWYILYDFDT